MLYTRYLLIVSILFMVFISCKTDKPEKLKKSTIDTFRMVNNPPEQQEQGWTKEQLEEEWAEAELEEEWPGKNTDEDLIEYLMKLSTYWVKIPVTYTYHFTGEIDGKYKFDMYLTVDGIKVNGHYNYLNKKPIKIKGILRAHELKIIEPDGHTFEGHFDYNAGTVSGTWKSKDRTRRYFFNMQNPFGVGYPRKTFKAHIIQEEYFPYIKEIKVNFDDGKEKIIELDDVEALHFAYGLSVEDYNFDGYQDISLVWMLPAYPPLRYKYIFWSPDEKDYYQSDLYEDLYTLVDNVNFRAKTVSIQIDGRHYSDRIYKYIDGKFYTIYEEYLTGDPGLGQDFGVETAYYKIVNGESVSISQKEYNRIYGE